jgi:hypothetical protein
MRPLNLTALTMFSAAMLLAVPAAAQTPAPTTALPATPAPTSATPAPARTPRPASDGTITISARAVAVGVGYSWGDGVLRYHGHSYHFAVKGISVADVGYARITSHGRVFNLHDLADFDGTYGAVTGEATLGDGTGGQYLRNDKGVVIHINQTTRGVRLEASADGIQFALRH